MFSALAQAPANENYDALVKRAVNLIQSEDFTQAAQVTRDAIALKPDGYEGYLYLGITRFRQEAVADAEVALQKALSLAPADRKARVQDALDLVSKTSRFRELMTSADQAENDGARAKAARTYAEAWWLFPDRIDIAAKALKGLTATNNDFEAARIWNTLSPAQKKDNAAALQGISVNIREVKNENDRRRLPLAKAIVAGQLDQATEIARPMAQADQMYAPIFAVLLFLKNDRGAIRAANSLKPEQLVQMEFFTEAQMNQMVRGPLFRSYLEDVVGGDPDRTIGALQPIIDKPGLERRKREQFLDSLSNAKNAPDSQLRLKALQDLRKQNPNNVQEIDPEIRLAAKAAAADLYGSIVAFFRSLPRATHPPLKDWRQEDISGFFASGNPATGITYVIETDGPCKTIRIEGEGASPDSWSKYSYNTFHSEAYVSWKPIYSEEYRKLQFDASELKEFGLIPGGKAFAVHINDLFERSTSGSQTRWHYSMQNKKKEFDRGGNTEDADPFGLNFYFDRKETAERLRDLLTAAQDACRATGM